MHTSILQFRIPLCSFLFSLGFVCAAGCSRENDSSAAPPIGTPPKAGEFDKIKLLIDGKDALHETRVLNSREPCTVVGEFRFAKPFKGRPPIGSILVLFTKVHKGRETPYQSGAADLTFFGKRQARFLCKINRTPAPGEYSVKVRGNNSKIIMETKVRVTD